MKRSSRNSYEILPIVENVLRDRVPKHIPFFVLGGIMTAALRDERTIIDFDEKHVTAPKDVAIPTRRKNGTRRDIDILIADVLAKDIGKGIASDVTEAIDNELDVSVFGLDDHEEVQQKSRITRQATEWLSRRTIDENGVHRYELFPLAQAVESASYEPWILSYNSDSQGVSVLHPVGHALAYRMRSISGVRPKDKQKLADMEGHIYSHPEAREVYHDGVFQEWALFADALARLRTNHGASMKEYCNLACTSITRPDIMIAQAKSSLLGMIELVEPITKIAQSSRVQILLKPLTRHH